MGSPMWKDSGEIGAGRILENAALDAYQKVGWLNIAMNDAVIVGALQTCRRLQQVVPRLFRRNGPAETKLLRALLQPVPQRPLGQVGHDQVGDRGTIRLDLFIAKVIQWQYMVMFQFGHGTRLALKTCGSLFPFGGFRDGPQVSRNDFYRDFSPDARMLRQINITHPTTFFFFNDTATTESFP